MDVKSAFLNGFISEAVFVNQPPSFENSQLQDHVFKLTKALYGLKQASRAWYDRFRKYLLDICFTRGKLTLLFLSKSKIVKYFWYKYM